MIRKVVIAILLISANKLFANDFIPDLYPVKNYENVYTNETIERIELSSTWQKYIEDGGRTSSIFIETKNENVPMVIISTARGIVQKVSSYNEDDNIFYDISITHSNGFRSIYKGLTEVNVSFNEWVTKGQEIGTIYNYPRFNYKGLEYEIWYLGYIINPEILIYRLYEELSLDSLMSQTEEIVEFGVSLEKSSLDELLIEYDGQDVNLRESDTYFSEIFGEPINIKIEEFENRDKPEFDQIITEYNSVFTVRYAYDDLIYGLIIKDDKIKIFKNINIDSTINAVINSIGMPSYIQMNKEIPSSIIKQYILQNGNENIDRIYGLDYFTNDKNGNKYDLYLDIESGVVSTIGIYYSYD
ncbi:MAG: M23 family metallopeptidase [Sphaerochaetaceae bacterium]|nr:M23 family metallopeptidase [Sphaerochaetaceae bacterium]